MFYICVPCVWFVCEADPYWHQAGLILYQLAGMVDGYNAAQPNQNLSFALMDMLLINLNGQI